MILLKNPSELKEVKSEAKAGKWTRVARLYKRYSSTPEVISQLDSAKYVKKAMSDGYILAAHKICLHGLMSETIKSKDSKVVYSTAKALQRNGLQNHAIELVATAVDKGVVSKKPYKDFLYLVHHAMHAKTPKEAAAFAALGFHANAVDAEATLAALNGLAKRARVKAGVRANVYNLLKKEIPPLDAFLPKNTKRT